MAAMTVRFNLPKSRVDLQAIAQMEAEHEVTVVTDRISTDGTHQVRTADGELYDLDMLRQRRRWRPGPDTDPLPPAPAMPARAA